MRTSRPEDALLADLRGLAGPAHVLTGERATRRYRQGYRFGSGSVRAVVRPGSLVELWRVARACVGAGATLLMQAANTGLTGGSTPDGDDYPGGVVLVSTDRIGGVHLIDEGRQTVCLPGATLFDLERRLEPLGREPHSVIGSSCIGASVLGGVCNNSGGALVQRGPAFTQLALFGQVGGDGVLRLVNHLGIELAGDEEAVLAQVERGDFPPAAIERDPGRWAHDHAYRDRVRAIDEPTPARFNADPACLFETSGCAGKLVVFAVRLDTFPKDAGARTFYVGTNDPATLTALRRALLGGAGPLPIAGEYLHRGAFDVAERYGKDTFVAIQRLGTRRLPALFRWKGRLDVLARATRLLPASFADRLLQRLAALLPRHLPARITAFRDRFEHHLLLKVEGGAVAATEALLTALLAARPGAFFLCSEAEANAAFLHRFAAAGAAVRYRAIHADQVADIVALDVALPRNAAAWTEVLPPELEAAISHKLYYGHFLCHVFHQDYVVRAGHDPHAVEQAMLKLLDQRGAECPAEHNVGHLYAAKPALAAFYRELDPANQLNPGIGHTTKARHWAA